MNALMKPREVHIEALDEARLDAVMRVEQQAYSHPWSRGNFLDSMRAGYRMRVLLGGLGKDEELLGYYVAMRVVDEVHLLNLTVTPKYQRQGWGRVLLDALTLWSRSVAAKTLWLEVRASNERAIRVYEAYGYEHVSVRKN